MALEFTQEEVERELADRLPHGMRREIARVSGLGESYIKRQYNPDDETASCAFRLLQIACAFDEIDADAAEAFWQTLVRFRELSKPHVFESKARSLNVETGRLGKEIADFFSAKITDQPYDTQMRELLEAEAQLRKVKSQLIRERFEAKTQ